MTEIVVSARPAAPSDIPELVRLYRLLEEEMQSLHPMWNKADGLPEPVELALEMALQTPTTQLYVGEVDGVPLGFLMATVDQLLPQAKADLIGVIRLVVTEIGARGVGVGEALREAAVEEFRRQGIRRFDAHVLPGHRLAKNFFEAGGFSARSIVMHHDDDRQR